jgi:hypothetical protein
LPNLRQADGSRQIDKAICVLTAVALPVITHTSAPKSGYPYSAPILSLKLAAAVQASPFIADLPIEDFEALRELEINGRQARSIRVMSLGGLCCLR